MDKTEGKSAFLSAISVLPDRLWQAAHELCERQWELCEEIRIRPGLPAVARSGGQSTTMGEPVTQDELDELIARATSSSVHTYSDQINNGFITLAGGHRLGICGSIAPNGAMSAFSSCSLRIAREIRGVSCGIIDSLYKDGFKSTLIVAPPGAGKTTLLRDMVRTLSQNNTVCIADSRYELAAMRGGERCFDVGCCDIISGGNKSHAIELLLRAMTPQIIAADEITAQEDARAICGAAYTGCRLIATAHGSNIEQLGSRAVYRELIEGMIFDCIIIIAQKNGVRNYRLYKAKGGGECDKADRSSDDSTVMLGDRVFHELYA